MEALGIVDRGIEAVPGAQVLESIAAELAILRVTAGVEVHRAVAANVGVA
jgi:hypothetical protein